MTIPSGSLYIVHLAHTQIEKIFVRKWEKNKFKYSLKFSNNLDRTSLIVIWKQTVQRGSSHLNAQKNFRTISTEIKKLIAEKKEQ